MAKTRPTRKAKYTAKAKHAKEEADDAAAKRTKNTPPPAEIPPSPPTHMPPPEETPEPSRTLLWWVFAGIIGLAVMGFLIVDRRKPRVEDRVVTKDVPAFLMVEKLVEVQTVDGKTVTVRMPVQEQVTRQIQEKETVVHAITPEQQLRLTIVAGVAIVLGLFLLGVLALWLRCHYYRRKVPKEISDWLRQLVSGILGALLGFLGTPPGETTKPQPSPPAEVVPSGKR